MAEGELKRTTVGEGSCRFAVPIVIERNGKEYYFMLVFFLFLNV